MFGHKRDVVTNQLEVLLGFLLDQIEDRLRRDFVGQQFGVAVSIDAREMLTWIVIKYQDRAVRQRLDRNRIDCRRVTLLQRETRRERPAGSLPHLTSIGGLKLIRALNRQRSSRIFRANHVEISIKRPVTT